MDVGDRLFLYTHGIVEEENPDSEYFGYGRLKELLVIHAESDPETLCDSLLESLASHVGRSNFDDDVTIFSWNILNAITKKPKCLIESITNLIYSA